VLMAVWFAAPLVVFHERGAVDALKESFAGCLKNIVPFLVYGVIFFVLGIVASIPLALGWLVLGPMAAASIYTAYRDIYFTA
ncbi:MAG TPA: BPSS1780 family membrane protein, partial [Ramlibacter sp.]|uniref:BPSS1780 family membrane protein n=1 Tax=Ramlibacter sp. TaxID=1917967 RepID=UPI002D7EC0F9